MRQIQQDGPTDPDELTIAQDTDRSTWGLPSDEGMLGQAPGVIPAPTVLDYAEGIFVGAGLSEDAQPVNPAAHLIRARVDAPRQFELPHEATHRRYEAPQMVPIIQTAAGFTQLLPTRMGLHYCKLIAMLVTLDAAGTLQFVQGSNDGSVTAPMSGAIPLGQNLGFVLPPAAIETPWLFTSPDVALGIFTVTGKAQGFAVCCYSPYDQ